MVPSDAFLKKVENDYLLLIATLLRTGEIDFATAKKSAQEMLTLLPFTTYEDMQTKLKQFTEKYKTLRKLYISFLKDLEQDKTNHLIERMRGLMKDNKIDEALQLAK